MNCDYDIIICGSGMVGSALACLLAPIGLRVALLEVKPLTVTIPAECDQRAIALTYTSQKILQPLWQHCAKHATPIQQVTISERGNFGAVRLRASELSVAALGYVLPAHLLAQTLFDAVQAESRIQLICPAELTAITHAEDHLQINLLTAGTTKTLSTKLLIGADGSLSTVRTLSQIPVREQNYHQHAIVATLKISGDHQHIAHERFQAGGPLALLPLGQQHVATIAVVDSSTITEWQNLSDAEYLGRLQKQFGFALGNFISLGQRQYWPLSGRYAEKLTSTRTVLIGNAANTLHPIAAQGFNLGLRDIALLLELIEKSSDNQPYQAIHDNYIGDPGALSLLTQYETIRKSEQNSVIHFTNCLAYLFHRDFFPVNLLRGLSLRKINKLALAKKYLSQFAMGQFGYLPWNAL